ncbi:hypothetical protein VTJ04DRAFT_6387 [Mycothermus thermophilus]|uniref:uncharacterized protein n=1 Tax=Humicola insolens TaxID=85995 RepID=UPI003742DA05
MYVRYLSSERSSWSNQPTDRTLKPGNPSTRISMPNPESEKNTSTRWYSNCLRLAVFPRASPSALQTPKTNLPPLLSLIRLPVNAWSCMRSRSSTQSPRPSCHITQ